MVVTGSTKPPERSVNIYTGAAPAQLSLDALTQASHFFRDPTLDSRQT
jgi:hypothetical protein